MFYIPQNPTQYGPGGWCTPPPEILCPAQRPAWSAYREQSFGTGALKILSPTEAVWEWTSHTTPHTPSDVVVIKRSDARQKACALKHPQPFATTFNATTKWSAVKNATVYTAQSAKYAGFAKPAVDVLAPKAAAAQLKADLAWRVNDTLAGLTEKDVAFGRVINATMAKFNKSG